MEGLVNIQIELHNAINKGYSNYNKSPKERITKEYIEIRTENLERDWLSFRTNHAKLYEKHKPGDIIKTSYVTEEVYDKTEDAYITYKTAMKTTLNKILSLKADDKKNEDNSSKGESIVKLPKISIPTFSGKYSEWTTFRDLFLSLIHNSKALDNVQKLHYLKGHLTGEAEQLLRHTPITEANYNICWNQLEKRYNNKRFLANCALKRLFSQKRANNESASALKELLDTTTECLNSLQNLNVSVDKWDIIIIYIVSYKLDAETRKQWELHVTDKDSNELPTFDQFKTFVESRFRALECLEPKRPVVYQSNSNTNHSSRVFLGTATNSNIKCEFCSDSHKLCFCKQFTKQPINDRREFVAKHKICFNCLGSNHSVSDCKKPTTCRVCRKRHHSLLHPVSPDAQKQQEHKASENASSTANDPTIVACLTTEKFTMPTQVLLATALVKAETRNGSFQVVRALLDQGSQACFITEAAVQFLRLKKVPVHGVVSGLGQDKSCVVKHMVILLIQSRIDPQFEVQINAYVLNKITTPLPENKIKSVDWVDLKELPLADPQFNVPNKIDILLGADVYSCILKEGVIKSPAGGLLAQSTTLGWILSGAVYTKTSKRDKGIASATNNISVLHTQINLDDQLRQFWELEDQYKKGKILTEEEQQCEEIFKNTTIRTYEGRYVVKLPFKMEEPQCKYGQSRDIAVARLKSLEKRFAKDADLKSKYTEVIHEYLKLNHLRLVQDDDKRDEAVYLPHHAVVRNDKSTTKVRVVFNASEKNKKGVSLNNTLMVGPTLQADLRHTVLRWRIHVIGMVADIIKMYRQVRIADEHTMFQRIVWRDNPDSEVKDYELLTVTFGTASAPYLAVRALHQVSYDEGHKYPLAKDKVTNCFYVDDLMTGCSEVNEGKQLFKEMVELLGSGGFQLQKWSTNNKELLQYIHEVQNLAKLEKDNNKEMEKDKEEDMNKDNKNKLEKDKQDNRTTEQGQREKKPEKEIKLDDNIKILGLTWNPEQDNFQYSVNVPTTAIETMTKRIMISDIARIFDPLGWIAPSIIVAKIFIQKLWLTGLGWDEPLNQELCNEWSIYRKELINLAQIRIPRWVNTQTNDKTVELHGFSDASKAAYAAVVYIRTVDASGKVHVSLLASKTRVAPIKQISIPRLELCGAVLLSRLLVEMAEVLCIPMDKIRAWTDSTVVLAWLNKHPSHWQTFVGNRVAEILTAFNSSQWFHISTRDNPADCASRGLLPSELVENTIWFSGPSFLKNQDIVYKKPKQLDIRFLEAIKTNLAVVPETAIVERFSSLQRLLRVVAYCRRFVNKNRGHLKKIEIDEALKCCIKITQIAGFTVEYQHLEQNQPVSNKSKLKSLSPYIDSTDIIRVGGRIGKSHLDETMKHPIVLPKDTHFTKLIVADAHLKSLHGGPSLMMNYLRTGYWIFGVRSLTKQHVHRCVICAKNSAHIRTQMMGSLPSVRCVPARPFLNSGVDYAGPINIRASKGRGHRSYKGYISLFICMATRAIHLEVVSDMTTQAFLAAFKRFVSRRGHCAHLWSDNGTTFVGASKELQQLTSIQQSVAEHLEISGTEWHFIPPHAPNFGGLWEAGVKSTKFHLKRVIGDSTPTYEELSTLLCQVEACVNSRPMSIINTSDPGEPLPLTPGHFLIGEPLLSVVDDNYENSNVNCLTRWQFVQRMLQTFWKRWSYEYLATLMNRYKWSSKIPEPNIGDVVLVKEDDLPPSRWLLGRIVQKHTGTDNITRVVTLKTKSSTMKRPTSKICILPVAE